MLALVFIIAAAACWGLCFHGVSAATNGSRNHPHGPLRVP